MNNKMKVGLFLFLPLLLMSCESRRNLTTDIVPALRERETWGVAQSFSVNNSTSITENDQESLTMTANFFERYENGFTAEYITKEVDQSYVTQLFHAYTAELMTYKFDPNEGDWEVLVDPLKGVYEILYNEHFVTNLTAVEDEFIYGYDDFIARGSKKGLAATVNEYKSTMPNAKISATLKRDSTGGYRIEERVSDFKLDPTFYIKNDYYLKLSNRKPDTLSYHLESGNSKKISVIKLQFTFYYESTLQEYPGPFYEVT
ncbi:MAG TPA: hypothetical protein VFD05_05095 [Bacilli bacterium]|nr:hypothetical protein [Bacilli bacterium]